MAQLRECLDSATICRPYHEKSKNGVNERRAPSSLYLRKYGNLAVMLRNKGL